MANNRLTDASKRDILNSTAKTVFTHKISVAETFLARLKAEDVMDNAQANSIREAGPQKSVKQNALRQHLLQGSTLQFINFCLVLYESGRQDIVEEDFGLNKSDLETQRGKYIMVTVTMMVKKTQQRIYSFNLDLLMREGSLYMEHLEFIENDELKKNLEPKKHTEKPVTQVGYPLTHEKKDTIMKDHSKVFLERISTRVTFMSELIEKGIVDNEEAADIQEAHVTLTEVQKQALITYFEECAVKKFIDFCILLHDDHDRSDIIEAFGLNIENLRRQKREIESSQLTQEGAPIGQAPTCDHTKEVHQEDHVDSLIDLGSSTSGPSPGHLGPPAAGAEGGADIEQSAVPSWDAMNSLLKKRLSHMTDCLEALDTNTKKRHQVVVAILDSGIYTAHPKLKDYVIHSIAMPGTGDPHNDSDNHGTLSAGIVVNFASPIVKIVNVKVTDGRLDTLRKGFEAIKNWRTSSNQKVDIVLTSINNPNPETPLDVEFNTLLSEIARSKIIIASAGNPGVQYTDGVCYPATREAVLGIGSCDLSGNRSRFSPCGSGLDFILPGEGFKSTSRPPTPGNQKEQRNITLEDSKPDYWQMSAAGTSFSSPHCAGVVAVILAYIQQKLGVKFRENITSTDAMRALLKEVANDEKKNEVGYGCPRVDKLSPEYLNLEKLIHRINPKGLP